jgi:hypothetical protein
MGMKWTCKQDIFRMNAKYLKEFEVIDGMTRV